jgi:hypothetical protein
MAHELEIKSEKIVKFRLDQSVFTCDVDKHGRLQVPESVLEKVPPFVRKLVKNIVIEMGFDSNQVHKRVYYLDVDHQEWCAEANGLGNCNCDPVSTSYTSKKPIQQIGISIGDEYVELKYGESVFKLGLKKNGYPVFPESVKKELPPEISGIVAGRVSRMRKDGRTQEQINLDIMHDYGCDELAGIGKCACDPVLSLVEPDEPKVGRWGEEGWGVLTCVVCRKSHIGDTGSYRVTYNYDKLFEKHWVIKDNEEDNDHRFYWAFSNKTLICEDCLRDIMSETRIRFPNVIDVARSPSVRRRGRSIRDRGRLRLIK